MLSKWFHKRQKLFIGLAHCNFISMKVVTEMAEVSFRQSLLITYVTCTAWYVIYGKLVLGKQSP